jgi:hypothetical protein
MKILGLLQIILILSTSLLWANGKPEVLVTRATGEIQLDGNLDEDAWVRALPASDFWQHFPTDSLRGTYATEVYFLFDEKNLYVGAKCYASGNDYIVPSLKRDYRAGGNDNLSFLFDPFNDGTNAFMFGTNPFGVRREALISEGGGEHNTFKDGWDNKWDGASKIHDGYWTCEIAIPFKTLRYNSGSRNWRFNCYRFDTQSNEWTTWHRIPLNQSIFNLAFMGDMIWEEPPEEAGPNISVIPYTSGSWVQDFESEIPPKEWDFGIGGDAKIAITPGMNLDLTVNPDFSQVEVDRQVTNLSRFEIFFPERRQFFTENADLFGSFGSDRINPFFSRRIGIVEDTLTETNIPNRIIFGTRLSGKLNDNWRVGLLNMTTETDRQNGLPSFNYTVATTQHKVFSRSNISAIFVNKQALNPESSDLFDQYNRVVGLDYNLASEDNQWTGNFFVMKAFTVEDLEDQWAQGARLSFRKTDYEIQWSHSYVGENFDAQVGFVPRKDFFRMNPEFKLFFYPKKGAFNKYDAGIEYAIHLKPGFGRSDQDIRLNFSGQLRDNSRLRINISHEYTYLFEEFDPTRKDETPLPAESEYSYTSLDLSYSSDSRKRFSYRLSPTAGQFFNGYRIGLRGSLSYRFQPFGSVSLDYNVNYLDLPKPYAEASLFLIGPRIDITFSKSLFLTTFIQYNSQIENMNINARLQWRFAPVSDFYLVYTNNYLTSDFSTKNRSIVAKATYWLNL